MLEHIFRNMSDIRVFDVVYCDYSEGMTFDVDDIMDILEYPYALRLQVEDSIDHLVKEHIIEEQTEKVPSWYGCRTCSYTDKLHLPRVGEHKKHLPYTTQEIDITVYRIALNKFTEYLFRALFEATQLSFADMDKNEL
jgi:hypothetical protein